MDLDWGDGCYETTAQQLEEGAERAIERAAIVAGERVLDVGCGTGNAALIAARRGARVTGVDPASRLLAVARQRADDEGLAIDFARGDAAAPGVPDGNFDAAVAVFSILFAPDPEAAVAGVVRAVRPGGRVVVTTWVVDGPIHASSMVLLDAMRDGAEPPPPSRWAAETSIRALFAPHDAAVSIVEETLAFEAPSAEAWLADQEANQPFWRAARAALTNHPEPWAHLRARSLEILRDGNEADGGFRATSRYRIVRADLPR